MFFAEFVLRKLKLVMDPNPWMKLAIRSLNMKLTNLELWKLFSLLIRIAESALQPKKSSFFSPVEYLSPKEHEYLSQHGWK